MSNLPTVPEIIDQLRWYKVKAGLTNATTATAMATFGWGTSHWSTLHVAALMNGTAQPTEVEKEFIILFLQDRFYAYNVS